MANYVATAEAVISATPAQVWLALTDPKMVKRYMFGTDVVSDWQQGSSIVWKGEYEGKAYEDKGTIVEIEAERRLRVTHFSPLSGLPDVPENYHTLTYELDKIGDKTHVWLIQDQNATQDEARQAKSNWEMMLGGLKAVVEKG
jgi:uncharacterized protein YndB with AHSA1/START domain